MSNVVKPMLAGDITDCLEKLSFPVYVTPKLDGVRALCTDVGVMSRSWKAIPNKQVQKQFSSRELTGLDGELIVGSPTAPDVYRRTQSVTARADSTENVTLYVFDEWNLPEHNYLERTAAILDAGTHLAHAFGIKIVPSYFVDNLEDLLRVETGFLEEGYEGCILRNPNGLYKNGRSTVKEQGMLKLKRFADGEAIVVALEEEMENGNEAKKDAFGRTERSSHKANLKGKGRMGALVVRDTVTGVEFKIGTGFSAANREWFWENRSTALVVKYRHFTIGAKDKPRFPKFVGLREGWDL
jgi:DNA ligase 1